MENDTEQENSLAHENQANPNATQTSDFTQLESKATAVVITSDQSHMTTSALSTEPALITEEGAIEPHGDLGTSNNPQVNTAAEKCEQSTTSDPNGVQKDQNTIQSPSNFDSTAENIRVETGTNVEKEIEKDLKESEITKKEKTIEDAEMSLDEVDSTTLNEGKEPVVNAPTDGRETSKDKETEEIKAGEESHWQKQKRENEGAEIQEENIKYQLQEIIKEIDLEVAKEEDTVRHHTWKPRGNYEIKKTVIQYDEIIPSVIPDVKLTERPKSPVKPSPMEQGKTQKEETQLEPIKVLRHSIVNGDPVSPLEIPLGIPLLARILPKLENGEEESREKIPLERLFTPATDTGEIIPQKKKKAFASSCFYRPDHPTIDDQVELAHKISVSLIDENNKTSKGQTMYMKRKNRSSKWIHQASEMDMEELEEERKPSLEKPPLKLVLNPKGMQDYNAVQRHYEDLMTSTQTTQQISRMEVGKEIASDLESPSGKGAALFAKRKKRMDKFIIDETNVQKQSALTQEENRTTNDSSASTLHQNFSSAPQEFSSPAFNENASLNNSLPNIGSPPSTAQAGQGNLQLPDLSQILTQPLSPEKTSSTFTSRSAARAKPSTSRSRSADSKPVSAKPGVSIFNSPLEKTKGKSGRAGGESNCVASGRLSNVSPKSFVEAKNEIPDLLTYLRPGSPPVVLVPDGAGGFIEKKEKTEESTDFSSTTEVTKNNEGGAIYTAEVKVVQNPSLPSTPIIDFSINTIPDYSILDQLSTTKEEEKRKSFNLAAKGWGTYNAFYTPIHLGDR